ncbi:hypothetical protein TWF506_003212 [Arthrobotrys conoides]|uniref:Uncharacterized protein n=1 Tax=Arthrobotrys conoides TaxID=74498 RepID=A0AAN8RRH1_9PEZI
MSFVNDPTDFDTLSETDDWGRTFDQIGISVKLKNAILMPEFEDLRYTASSCFWAAQAIEDNYYALLSLGPELEDRAIYLQSINYKDRERKKASKEESASQPPSLPNDGPSAPQKQPGQPIESAAPEPSVSKPLGTTTTLYRASNLETALIYYDAATGLASDEAFGSAPGDLSGRTPVTYWTPQKEVADRYAKWAKHKSPESKVIITEVEVSEELVSQLKPLLFWGLENGKMNPDFQQFTCLCRRAALDRSFPNHLQYVDKADMIIAHILRHKNAYYNKMDNDGWKKIDASNLLKIEIDDDPAPRLGIQWVFKSREAQRQFSEHCQGKVLQYNMHRLTINEVELKY